MEDHGGVGSRAKKQEVPPRRSRKGSDILSVLTEICGRDFLSIDDASWNSENIRVSSLRPRSNRGPVDPDYDAFQWFNGMGQIYRSGEKRIHQFRDRHNTLLIRGARLSVDCPYKSTISLLTHSTP